MGDFVSATGGLILKTAIAIVWLRFRTCPTLIRATSFIVGCRRPTWCCPRPSDRLVVGFCRRREAELACNSVQHATAFLGDTNASRVGRVTTD
jgi:hypothetical protein